VKGTALQCMLHSFLLYRSGTKSLVRSHFGFSFSDVAGNSQYYTKMQSKVRGEIYPAFFFGADFRIVATKKLQTNFSLV